MESFADAFGEMDAESEMEADAETEVEADADADADAELDAELDTELDAEVDAEAEAETEVDAEAETEVEAEADAESEDSDVLAMLEMSNEAAPFKVAGPKRGGKQVHVHVKVAAPVLKRSNAGLRAMVDRIARKNTAAAEKMEQILDKLKTQDCRGGNCLPHPGKAMEQWKADWILETEETGKTVP